MAKEKIQEFTGINQNTGKYRRKKYRNLQEIQERYMHWRWYMKRPNFFSTWCQHL
jgi:hypothetical protein